MEFVGHIVLSSSLPCDYSCLNRKIKIVIAGYVGYLYTPVLKKEFRKETLPFLSEPFPTSTVTYTNDVIWGRLINTKDNISSVKTLKFVFNVNDESIIEEPDEFLQNTNQWLKRFEENLFPLFWILYLSTVRVVGENNRDFTYYYKNRESKPQDLYEKKGMRQVLVSIETKKIELQLLKKIISLSNQNKEISIGYRLLRDAHKCFLAGDYRESILYIGTCLDILLDILILKRLPTPSKELKMWILKGNRTIFKKIEIIHKFGPKIIGLVEVQKKISNIRNDVIHAGLIPSENECLQAYKLMAKLMIENQKRIYV